MSISFNIYFPAKGVTDHDEPDLAAYAAIDMSTLRDVRRTGMDYVLSMEALMHTTPGLKPGYLPERDAHYLLSGVSIFGPLLTKFSILSSLFVQFWSTLDCFLFPGPEHADTQFLHG